ncbi:MAG: hypothetical protein IJ899_03655 [Blautia sp.]|nr:hypothetical protein [Blautia sp.]
MLYTVTRIDEDLDFGCEERQENEPVKAVVTIKGDDGEETVVKMADAVLYERKIDSGTVVFIDEEGLLQKL